jgi:alpha-tubulin suppressor-like RCC1 family protein
VTENLAPADDAASSARLSRRTVLAGSAWAVPAIVVTTATPAFAASTAPTLAVTAPNMQTVAAGTTPVTATATDNTGQPLTGGVVTFSGPAGTSFSPQNATITNGVATTTLTTTNTWATPGSTLTVTASTTGATGTAALTVLGANARAGGYNGNPAGSAGTGQTGATIRPPAQLSQVFPSPIVALSGGSHPFAGSFSVALLQDGTVWTIGSNVYGALGDGTTTSRATWARVPSLTGVTRVACTLNSVYAVLNDGRVLAWGYNGSGQIGDGTNIDRSIPTAVGGITGAVEISATGGSAIALLSTGEVRTWGYNGYGQLGNGTTTSSNIPISPGLTGVAQVRAGGNTCYALLSNGQVRAWGYGRDGQIGNAASTDVAVPTAVSGITTATQISAGSNTGFALLSTGELRGWGYDGTGSVGDGTTTNRNSPTPVVGAADAVSIVSTVGSSFAQLATGEYKGWGSNQYGELNDGTTINRATPITLPGTDDIASFQAAPNGGAVFTLRGAAPAVSVTSANQQITAAGDTPVTATVVNGPGQPAARKTVAFTGPNGATLTPASATTDTAGVASTVVNLNDTWATPGSTRTITAAANGTTGTAALTVLGANAYGIGNGLALGTPATTSTVPTPTQLKQVFPSPIASLAVGWSTVFSLALLEDGTVWSIGNNQNGQLGDGTTTNRPTVWARVAGLSNVTQISAGQGFAMALLASGEIRSWGRNDRGQLGNGTIGDTPTPVAVTGITTAVSVSCGITSGYALLADGTVRSWGRNDNGQLGNGSTVDTSTPVQVSGLAGVTLIAAANGEACFALLPDGTIRSWGRNNLGQLGDGTTTDKSTPVTVVGVTGVTQIAPGDTFCLALTSAGTIRAWGSNATGQLGIGTTSTAATTTAVTVSGITTATQISAGLQSGYAIVSPNSGGQYGTLRSWGANSWGQLGDGTTTQRTTPIAIGGASSVTAILAGNGATAAYLLRAPR